MNFLNYKQLIKHSLNIRSNQLLKTTQLTHQKNYHNHSVNTLYNLKEKRKSQSKDSNINKSKDNKNIKTNNKVSDIFIHHTLIM
jgi:hypothetical protein